MLRGVGSVDPSTTLLGRPLPTPLVLAPTGFTRIADPDGELAVARVAAERCLPYTLSTLSTRWIEEGAAVIHGRKWFQVYVGRDRGLVKEMIDRAASAGYEALVLTVDTAVLGAAGPRRAARVLAAPQAGADTLLDGAIHPGWTWKFVRSEPITFANMAGRAWATAAEAVNLSDYINSQFDPDLELAGPRLVPLRLAGPVVLKGVQSVADAVLAAGAGIEAVALSNHGGRQLDGAPAPLSYWCRSPTPSATDWSSSATAASGAAATSSKPSPSAPRRAWPAGPTSTDSAPVASGESAMPSSCSTPTSGGRWL